MYPSTTEHQTLTLFGYIAPGWAIIRPLEVILEPDEDGSYIVSDAPLAAYGVGETPLAAHQDYVTTLIEYYQLLQSRAAADDASRALFTILQSYLQPSHAD